MVTTQTSPILAYVRQISSLHLAKLSDAELLERFASRQDETSFAVLVRRHGPLVLSVCRRVLRDGHMAEDCFQITFMLLARKASSMSQPNSLGPWLYGVATRTALKVRSQAARRRLREAKVAVAEAICDPSDREWQDLRPVLDESINSLPEKYRVPFVLHYLQGVTVTEIARQIGCPRGSIATRLARAREHLRARLLRRGVTLSAGCLWLTLSDVAASMSVPPTLALTTARTAALVAAGQAALPGLFPSFTTVFMEGVRKAMQTTTVKIASGCFVAALLAAIAGTWNYQSKAADAEAVKEQPANPAGLRREEPPPRLPVRFLSLAEARAIALEHNNDSLRVLASARSKDQGIILTGLNKDQDRADFERRVNQVLLNVETSYWNLYGAYWQLFSRTQAIHFAYDTWKMVRARHREGEASRAHLAQAENQYNQFRRERLEAIHTVLDNERVLRSMLGLPNEPSDRSTSRLFPELALQKPNSEDSLRLIPSDAPSLVEKQTDWNAALAQTMKNRPELRLARQDIKRTKEKSLERSRAYLVLQDQELKAERYLGLYSRRLSSCYLQIKAAKAQRLEFAKQLRKRLDEYQEGKQDSILNLVLESQRFWAEALATEFQAITTYNNSLCGWEYAKGSILEYAHITITEKPPADVETVPAAEYERKRARKLLGRESTRSVDLYLWQPEDQEEGMKVTFLTAPTLPCLWKAYPPPGEVEKLPEVAGNALQKMRRREGAGEIALPPNP